MEKPSPLGVWWLAVRPRTLSVSVAPVLVGSALAHAEQGDFLLWPALVAALAAMLIQIGTNLHNDVADFERGADPPDRLGPPRATAMGWLPARTVRRAAWISFALAFALGILLVLRGGWPIVAVGLASLLAGWAYTNGPRPIAYSALGEGFVIFFFGGAAVGGSYYLQTLSLSPAALLAALQVGLLGAAVISVNNTRDLATDTRVGKNTLAVRVGRCVMNRIYAAEVLLPYLLLPLLAALLEHSAVSAWFFALPCVSAGWALSLCRRFRTLPAGPGFNDLLAATAQLQAAYAALLALALIMA